MMSGEQGHREWICETCGFVYREEDGAPDYGIAPGTRLEDLPDDWMCPFCASSKSAFLLAGA